MKIHLDFETRSEVDIWEVGAWNYSMHPSTEVLCLAYGVDHGEIQLITEFPWETISNDIKDPRHRLNLLVTNPNNQIYAHNSFFELCIWNNIMARQGYSYLGIEKFRCTMAKSLAFGLPKALDKVANALRLSERKDKDGKAIMKKMARPRAPRKGESKHQVYWHESPDDFKRLYAYCKQDVLTEREVDDKLPELSEFEQEIWFLDQIINARGIHVDLEYVKKAIQILNQHTDQLNNDLVALTFGAVTKGTQVQSMLNYLNAPYQAKLDKFIRNENAILTPAEQKYINYWESMKLPNLQAQTVTEAIAAGKLSEQQIQVLRLRQELSKSATKKYHRMISGSDEQGVVRDNYFYHGAHTGRWSGKLLQLHNLVRAQKGIDVDKAIQNVKNFDYNTLRMIYPKNLMDVLSSCVRGSLIPDQGYNMHVVDYSAIEARCLFWLVDCPLGLSEFRNADAGTDKEIYMKMADRIAGDRDLGKRVILGCGYGIGAPKFRATCASYGTIISEEQSVSYVNMYRNTYHEVKEFWYRLDTAAKQAVNAPNQFIPCGHISYYYNPSMDYLFCVLPSGRYICYAEPRIQQGKFGPSLSYLTEIQSGWYRKDTYGGSLVENITQAIARDIMANAMPVLEDQGFHIIMHTHDEIVCQVPEGKNCVDQMIKIMCHLPKWAEGCPIKAEGYVTDRYKKG